MFRYFVAACLVASASAVSAQMTVEFTESAPTDRFRIINKSACPSGELDLTIDLKGSAAGLLFDTTGTGQGVEVFQPFVLTEGADYLKQVPDVADGARSVTLSISDLPAQKTVSFTIDVDDTQAISTNGQIRVAGDEIAGATVRLSGQTALGETQFSSDGTAVLSLNTCLT